MSGTTQLRDASAAVYRFGAFTFDSASHQLLHEGAERHLSPKAQLLLLLLLRARPRAVAREELYDALWPSTFVCETTLAGVVSELRRALSVDDGVSTHIRTVHGFGYAFSGQYDPASTAPALVLECEGQRHPLHEGEISVGRAPECSIVLSDPTVSRKHARLVVTDGRVWVEDLGSKNGTFVDDRQIRRSQVEKNTRIDFGGVAALIRPLKLISTQSHWKTNMRPHAAARNTPSS